MSKTYKHIQKNKEKIALRLARKTPLTWDTRHDYCPLWDNYLTILKSNPKHYKFYSKNPGWYNRLMTEIPNRRATRLIEKSLAQQVPQYHFNDLDILDSVIWPLAKKPKSYYW